MAIVYIYSYSGNRVGKLFTVSDKNLFIAAIDGSKRYDFGKKGTVIENIYIYPEKGLVG